MVIKKIRPTYDKWSITEILNMLLEGELETHPEYQRRKVWKLDQKIMLIDSIARGIPAGTISVIETPTEDNKSTIFQVIDGQQRLETIKEFFTDKTLKYPVECPVDEDDDPLPKTAEVEALEKYSDFSGLRTSNNDALDSLRGYQFPVVLIPKDEVTHH